MSLHVLEPGLHSLLVDFGRPRTRSLGVPVGGAADRFALAIGNALVGNDPNCCGLEISLAGPCLRAEQDVGCVVVGGRFEIETGEGVIRSGATFTLHAGEELRIGGAVAGFTGYLCVAGGLHTPRILDSQTGLRPIRAGDTLACVTSSMPTRFVADEFEWNREPHVIRATDGPQADWFRRESFFSQEFRVLPASNRMGMRLEGNPLEVPDRELTSEPVCPGSVQVIREGQCIVIGVDGQTIGGYPKIAQVIAADLDKLGQLRPDDRIRFQSVPLAEAERLRRRKKEELNEWLTRLRTAERFGP